MTHVNRKTRGTHEIVGCIVLPGLQWAKYLVRVANGTYEIMYEGDLMDVCRRGECSNGAVITREKRSYDDWDAGPELHTFPPDLLDERTIRLSWAHVTDDHRADVERAATELVERATGRRPTEKLVINDLTATSNDSEPTQRYDPETFDFADTTDDLVIAVDAQNDFISGALGSELAERVVPELAHFLREFRGDKIFTRDTHDDDYLDTREGRCLPTIHARRNSDGWRLHPDVDAARKPGDLVIDKSAYGCVDLIPAIRRKRYRRIYVVGYDTEYCVLSNAVIARAADSEAEVRVIESLCGYADRDAHDVAVEAMLTLNVEIL